MTKQTDALPIPAERLEALATYYDRDTSAEMEQGRWVDPRPMKTTSLRLPADVVEALKTLAQTRGMRYTAFVREIIEHAVNGVHLAGNEGFSEINERLDRIEAAVTQQTKPAQRRATQKSGATSKTTTKSATAPRKRATRKKLASEA